MQHQLRLSIVVLACALGLGARAPEPRGEPALAPALHDCNGNGVEDTVDIALGSSSDANLDGVPDECQDDVQAFELRCPAAERGRISVSRSADLAVPLAACIETRY